MKEQEPYEQKRSHTIKIMVAIFAIAIIFGIVYNYASFPYKKSEVMPESRPASEEMKKDYPTDTSASSL